jgi:hypothetical protein
MAFSGSGSKKTVRFVNPENPKNPEKSAKIPLAGVLNVGDDIIRSLKATIGELEKNLKDTEFSLESVLAKNDALTAKNDRLMADNQNFYALVEKLRGESTKQNELIHKLTLENQKLNEENQKLNEENQKLNEENKKLKVENKNASGLIDNILNNSQSNSLNSTLSTVFPQSNVSNPRRLTTNYASNNEPNVIPDVIPDVKISNSNNGTRCKLPVKQLGSSVPEGYVSSVYYSSGVDNTDFMMRVSEMNNEQNRFTFAPDCARGGLYGYNLKNTSNDGGSLNTFSLPTVTSNKTKFNPFSLPTKQNSLSDA